MKGNRVCVGGIDLDKLTSVRLLDRDGFHETKDNSPYNICEIWEIEYVNVSRRLPHSEDSKVIRRKRIEILAPESVPDILLKRGFGICSGSIGGIFGGKLKCTHSGALYVSGKEIPDSSTCFWICDKNIVRRDYHDKIRYSCDDGCCRYYMSYVGLDADPAQIIPQGSFVRLSLAHWWSPSDSKDEERCYLQLSCWY